MNCFMVIRWFNNYFHTCQRLALIRKPSRLWWSITTHNPLQTETPSQGREFLSATFSLSLSLALSRGTHLSCFWHDSTSCWVDLCPFKWKGFMPWKLGLLVTSSQLEPYSPTVTLKKHSKIPALIIEKIIYLGKRKCWTDLKLLSRVHQRVHYT